MWLESSANFEKNWCECRPSVRSANKNRTLKANGKIGGSLYINATNHPSDPTNNQPTAAIDQRPSNDIAKASQSASQEMMKPNPVPAHSSPGNRTFYCDLTAV